MNDVTINYESLAIRLMSKCRELEEKNALYRKTSRFVALENKIAKQQERLRRFAKIIYEMDARLRHFQHEYQYDDGAWDAVMEYID